MDQHGRKRDRRSKLTEEDVAQIKAHLQQGKSPAIIARYFEVNSRIIYNIRANETYRHIALHQRQGHCRNYPKSFDRSRFARVNKMVSVDEELKAAKAAKAAINALAARKSEGLTTLKHAYRVAVLNISGGGLLNEARSHLWNVLVRSFL
jgi:hypothetical protein